MQHLVFDEKPSDDDIEAVRKDLIAFNDEIVGPANRRPFGIVVRDREGRIQAGLTGRIAWQWLYVEILWVASESRGNGLGRRLMERAEEKARAEGCFAVYLDTFDSQAPRFYEKCGYQRFGTLEGFPPGSSQHHYVKRLS